jgi:DNA-binding NarL/FixJ family response regulator
MTNQETAVGMIRGVPIGAAPIRVFTVDDHPMLREGIAAMLEGQKDMVLVGEAASGREGIDGFRRHRPDITLMDLRMPDMSGVEVIQAIRREFPLARIVVLTTYRGDVHARESLAAGAFGYLLKSALREELVNTVRSVHAGQHRISAEIAAEIAEHVSDETLSEREVAVLKCVANGSANKQIATQLGISGETVKAHMTKIMEKLRAQNRTHAIMIAMKRGVIG